MPLNVSYRQAMTNKEAKRVGRKIERVGRNMNLGEDNQDD